MAINHLDEILLPALDTDSTAKPRYNIRAADGTLIAQNATLELANAVAQEGTPVNKPLLDEFLAASGVTAGTSTAYTLAQTGYAPFDGAFIRFRLHAASGASATLDVNGTGAKPLRDILGEAMPDGIPAGAWLTAIYSSAADAYIIAGGAGGGEISADQVIETTAKQFVSAAEKTAWNTPAADVLYCQQYSSGAYSALEYTLPTTYRYFRVALSRFKISDFGYLYGKFTETDSNFYYGFAMAPNSSLYGEMMYQKVSGGIFGMPLADTYSNADVVLDMARTETTKITGTAVMSSDGGGEDEYTAFAMGNFSALTTPKTLQIYAQTVTGSSLTIKSGSIVILGVK